ncbi:MAG: hypothetical protein SWY16_07420 [Cyanobacteriota bacterium]|nr:hypothetical protein [Cyanobacteriota bacterium]
MKSIPLVKISAAIAFGAIVLGIVGFSSFRWRYVRRAQFCDRATPLDEVEVDGYGPSGAALRQGTILREVIIQGDRKIDILVIPKALSSQTWSKLPSSAIEYLGKGGDRYSLSEWLRPDYFYRLDVPANATGLAFGRLCHRNNDVTVMAIETLEEIAPKKININDEAYLSTPANLREIEASEIFVNAGSDRRDILGEVTEVYFTTVPSLKFDSRLEAEKRESQMD